MRYVVAAVVAVMVASCIAEAQPIPTAAPLINTVNAGRVVPANVPAAAPVPAPLPPTEPIPVDLAAPAASLPSTAAGGRGAAVPSQPPVVLQMPETPDVAYAAPPVAEVAALEPAPACPSPCFVVGDYSPFRTCKASCDPQVCARGWGAYPSRDVCCAPGVAFPDGCSQRPSACYVVESYTLRTCIRDDRKCLQGYGVYPSEDVCCAPGAAFPEGCAPNITVSAQPCWVVDTYYPARLCRRSRTLCTPEAGVQSWPSQAACCAPKPPNGAGSGAFDQGCSRNPPKAPCYVIDTYWPSRTCRLSNDVATCNRGWGVFQNMDVCCAPGAAFSDGCSNPAAAAIPDLAAPGGTVG